MALTSVFLNQPYDFSYPEGYNILEGLVVKQLGAYRDTLDNAQDLLIGATSNVQIEAAQNIQTYIDSAGSFDLYTVVSDGTVRSNTKVLELSAPNSTTTRITTSNQTLQVFGGDALKTTVVSHTSMAMGADGSNQFMSLPAGESFYFGNQAEISGDARVIGNAVVNKSLLVNDHIITYGNIYGSNINLWRVTDSNLPENNSISQVGFGFRVNDNHQLELVKYSKFENKTVAKKVAVFGQTKFHDGMNSDDGVVFTSINDIMDISNLPEMSGGSNSTVDLSKPIQTHWATAPTGIFYSSGNVGILTNEPQYPLDVNGEARFDSITSDVAVIQQTSTTSDVRLKNVMASKSPEQCFDVINRLRVTQYTFKNNDKKIVDGLIAQEVESVLPSAVMSSKYGALDDCRMIDYNQIIANLIGAVQHLSDLVSDRLGI